MLPAVLRISRHHPDARDSGIPWTEWVNLVEQEPDLRLINSVPGYQSKACWIGEGKLDEGSLDWSKDHGIGTLHPIDSLIIKMHAIARRLGATVYDDHNQVHELRDRPMTIRFPVNPANAAKWTFRAPKMRAITVSAGGYAELYTMYIARNPCRCLISLDAEFYGWNDYMVGRALFGLKRFHEAIPYFRLAAHWGMPSGYGDDDRDQALFAAGLAFINLRQISDAIEAFETAIDTRPWAAPCYALAQAYYLNNEIEKAIPLLQGYWPGRKLLALIEVELGRQ